MLLMEYLELCGEGGKQKITGSDVFLQRLQIMQLAGYINLHLSGHDAIDKISELCGEYTIEEAQSTLALWRLDLEAAEKQLERETNTNDDASGFDLCGCVIEVCRYLGYQIDRKNTSVSEFAGCMVRFKKYIAAQEKASKKKQK